MLTSASTLADRKATAFTLVELLVILVIMGVLAGSVVVGLQGADQVHALTAARQELSQAITFARTQSQSLQVTHRVKFGADGRSFVVEMKRTELGDEYVPARGMAGMLRTMGQKVRITQIVPAGDAAVAPDVLYFSAEGGTFAGTVRLTTDSGRTAAIEVLPVTGQVVYRD